MLLKSKSAQGMSILYKYLQQCFVVFSGCMHFQTICEFPPFHMLPFRMNLILDCHLAKLVFYTFCSHFYISDVDFYFSVLLFAPLLARQLFHSFRRGYLFQCFLRYIENTLGEESTIVIIAVGKCNGYNQQIHPSYRIVLHRSTHTRFSTDILCTDVSNRTGLCAAHIQHLPKTHPSCHHTNSN